MKTIALSWIFVLNGILASEPVKVVTTTTDLAWAARKIGGNFVSVTSLLRGTENPHYVDAVPEFIRLVAEAQIVCSIGLDLEVGWLPKVLARSGNSQVQPGGKGFCETGTEVTVLEKPTGAIDRTMGDVHAAGNPHYWLSPTALSQGSLAIKKAFIRVDPSHTAQYEANFASLDKHLESLSSSLKARLKGMKSTLAIEYHKEFTYFFDHYGIKSFGSIEEKPGIPPSAGRIAEIAVASKNAGVKIALGTEHSPKSTLTRFSELSGIKHQILTISIQPDGPNEKVKTYEELQNHLVNSLMEPSR